MAATKAAVVTGPMFGTLCRRRTRASVAVTAAIRSSEYASDGWRWRITARSGATSERRRPGRGRAITRCGNPLCAARGHQPAVLPQQRADERDVARPSPHQRIPNGKTGPDMALGIGEPVRRAVGPQPTGLGQGTGVAAVRLHLAGAGGIHGREVRVGDDHVVAERLQTSGDPFTLRRGFQQDLGRRPPAEGLGEPLGFGADPALDQLASLSQETDLAFPLVQVDANMVHGWPPSPCASERVISLWGTLCHHLESGVSRFIPSTLDSRLVLVVGFTLLVQAHLYPRTLFLQGEEDGAIPGRPAPRDRLGHLLLAQRAEAHRHARRARELHRQTDILSRQRQ